MAKYTKKQREAYFANLRKDWAESSKLAEGDKKAKALFREVKKIGNFSYASFYFTLLSMRANKFDGIPYVDCKTFDGWIKAGFQVKKGEKSKISGITWVSANHAGNEADENEFHYPKLYRLFHKSQVQAL